MFTKATRRRKPKYYGAYAAAATPDTVREAREAILLIITAPTADAVKEKALDTLQKLCSAATLSISHSSFYVGENT